jgi:hypothetical protein
LKETQEKGLGNQKMRSVRKKWRRRKGDREKARKAKKEKTREEK